MIVFEIINSNDPDFCRTHTTYRDRIVFGTQKCDMYVGTASWGTDRIVLSNEPDNFLIYSLSDEHCFLNNMKVKGTFEARPGDKLKFREFEIIIKNYIYAESESWKETFKTSLKKIAKEDQSLFNNIREYKEKLGDIFEE